MPFHRRFQLRRRCLPFLPSRRGLPRPRCRRSRLPCHRCRRFRRCRHAPPRPRCRPFRPSHRPIHPPRRRIRHCRRGRPCRRPFRPLLRRCLPRPRRCCRHFRRGRHRRRCCRRCRSRPGCRPYCPRIRSPRCRPFRRCPGPRSRRGQPGRPPNPPNLRDRPSRLSHYRCLRRRHNPPTPREQQPITRHGTKDLATSPTSFPSGPPEVPGVINKSSLTNVSHDRRTAAPFSLSSALRVGKQLRFVYTLRPSP
jgi:hypothetical protein